MRMRRILISAAITAFWLVMMGLLVRNHVLSRGNRSEALEVSPSLLTEQWRDYEEWMRLAVGGRSQGVSYTVIQRRPQRSGYVAGNRTWLTLEVLGGRHDFRLQTAAQLNSLFRLQVASAELRLDQSRMKFVALIDGLRLYYRWEFEGQSRVGLQRLEKPVSLLEAVRPLLARRLELTVGAVYRLPVLDSTWSLREGWAEVRVQALERIAIAGQPTEAYRLVFQLGPFTTTSWVNGEGEVLRREFADKMAMERIDPAEARARYPGIDEPFEIPEVTQSDFTRDKSDGALPEDEQGPLSLLGDLLLKSGAAR